MQMNDGKSAPVTRMRSQVTGKTLFIFASQKPLFNGVSRLLSSIVQLNWGHMLQDVVF